MARGGRSSGRTRPVDSSPKTRPVASSPVGKGIQTLTFSVSGRSLPPTTPNPNNSSSFGGEGGAIVSKSASTSGSASGSRVLEGKPRRRLGDAGPAGGRGTSTQRLAPERNQTKIGRGWWCRLFFMVFVYQFTFTAFYSLFLLVFCWCALFCWWAFDDLQRLHMTMTSDQLFLRLKTKGRMMGVSPGVQVSSPPIRRPLLSKCKIVKPRSGRVNDCSRICLPSWLDPVPSWVDDVDGFAPKKKRSKPTGCEWPSKKLQVWHALFLCIKAEGVWSVWSSRSILVLLTWL